MNSEYSTDYRLISQTYTDRRPWWLRVTESSPEIGIIPVGFTDAVIIEVTPREFTKIKSGHLPLPHGMRVLDAEGNVLA